MPTGKVIAVSRWSEGQIAGSGETSPKPKAYQLRMLPISLLPRFL